MIPKDVAGIAKLLAELPVNWDDYSKYIPQKCSHHQAGRVMSRCWHQKHAYSNQQHVGAEEENILNSTKTNGDGRNRNTLLYSYHCNIVQQKCFVPAEIQVDHFTYF